MPRALGPLSLIVYFRRKTKHHVQKNRSHTDAREDRQPEEKQERVRGEIPHNGLATDSE